MNCLWHDECRAVLRSSEEMGNGVKSNQVRCHKMCRIDSRAPFNCWLHSAFVACTETIQLQTTSIGKPVSACSRVMSKTQCRSAPCRSNRRWGACSTTTATSPETSTESARLPTGPQDITTEKSSSCCEQGRTRMRMTGVQLWAPLDGEQIDNGTFGWFFFLHSSGHSFFLSLCEWSCFKMCFWWSDHTSKFFSRGHLGEQQDSIFLKKNLGCVGKWVEWPQKNLRAILASKKPTDTPSQMSGPPPRISWVGA